MFWNKKKKEGEVPPVEMSFIDSSAFPEFKKTEDGGFSLSRDDAASMPETKIVTDRLYVISRGNIDLKEAQDITVHAAMANPEFAENLFTDGHVDLVWCSAYPDAVFGEYDLPDLLVGYVKQSEGDRYLKSDSQLIPIKGNRDGDDYYIMILVHTEL